MVDWQYMNIVVVMLAAYFVLPAAVSALTVFSIQNEFDGLQLVVAAAVGVAVGYVLLALAPNEYLDPQDEITEKEVAAGCRGSRDVKFRE